MGRHVGAGCVRARPPAGGRGIIRGYRLNPDPATAGYPIAAYGVGRGLRLASSRPAPADAGLVGDGADGSRRTRPGRGQGCTVKFRSFLRLLSLRHTLADLQFATVR